MTSRHLVDPELLVALDFFPRMEFHNEPLESIRKNLDAMYAAIPLPDDLPVRVENVRVPRPEGSPTLHVRLYRPEVTAGPTPAILHLHGGGYVIGSPGIAEIANRNLVAQLGCTIASVDYPLAPENAHPLPIESCYDALKWLHENAPELGVDRACIGVKGESAGGGLAAALALLARDRGEYPLAFQHLIQPMLDNRTGRGDPHPFAGEFVWTPVHNDFGWSSLLGAAAAAEDTSPYGAPARANDLAHLPKTFLAVGALDLFVEENMEYARRLLRAGVPVEFHIYPGAFHGFDLLMDTRVAQQAQRDSQESLQLALRS
jgi:triacylglycerol lipase